MQEAQLTRPSIWEPPRTTYVEDSGSTDLSLKLEVGNDQLVVLVSASPCKRQISGTAQKGYITFTDNFCLSGRQPVPLFEQCFDEVYRCIDKEEFRSSVTSFTFTFCRSQRTRPHNQFTSNEDRAWWLDEGGITTRLDSKQMETQKCKCHFWRHRSMTFCVKHGLYRRLETPAYHN